jgi:hypothetical protein
MNMNSENWNMDKEKVTYQYDLGNPREMTSVATTFGSGFAVSDLIPNTSDGPD